MEVVIGPYRAVEQRYDGQSAHGIGQWHGEDLRTGDEVSITVLPTTRLDFALEEIAAPAPVTHPHLLTVIDVVEPDADDRAAIIAPWPAGGLLADLITRRGGLSVGETLTVLIPLANAVATAHSAGIRHGGICPEDIWFDDVGRPFLGPLAVSRAISAQNHGLPIGSRDVAPEVVRGEAVRRGPITLAADVFSLGSVALACLTGRSAWPADEPADVLIQSAAGLWPDPPDDAGPPELISLIREMLSSTPGRRPGAGAVAARLSRVGIPQPVRFTDPTAHIEDRERASTPRHLSAVPESHSQSGEVGQSESGAVDRTGGDRTEGDPTGGDPTGGDDIPPAGTGAVPTIAHSPAFADSRESRAPQPPSAPTAPAEADPVDGPGDSSRLAAGLRALRRLRGGRGRGSGSPSGQPGPVGASPELAELLRHGLLTHGVLGRADEPPTQGLGRLTPVARTGLILLAGVLVTLVALQVSVWWDNGSDLAVVDSGSAAADGDNGLLGTVPDWTFVVTDLDSARSKALAAADPRLLTAVYNEGSPEFQADAQIIGQLADQGLRVVDGVHQIVSVTVLESPSVQTFVTSDDPGPILGAVASSDPNPAPDAGTVRLAVVDTLPAHPIVDAGGQQVGLTESRAEQRRILVLDRTALGFRIVAVEPG